MGGNWNSEGLSDIIISDTSVSLPHMIYLNNKLYGNFISKLLYNKFFHNQGTQIPYSQFEINRFLLPFYLLYPANFTFIDSLLIFPLVQLGNDVKTHTVLAGDFLIHIVATSRIKWG